MCHLLLVVVIRFASSFLRYPLCICGVFVRLCVYTFDIMLIVTNVSFVIGCCNKVCFFLSKMFMYLWSICASSFLGFVCIHLI